MVLNMLLTGPSEVCHFRNSDAPEFSHPVLVVLIWQELQTSDSGVRPPPPSTQPTL
jgi:hypothetical protein